MPSWIHSAVAREALLADRGEPLFLADWERTLMLHYEVEPNILQPYVPFALDVLHGKAYVSLVAFTMRGLAPRRGGRACALLFEPIATHEFLNVRTYVKHQGECGIYFLAEWLPNKLSVLMGRPVFGLPYRLGKHAYQHDHASGRIKGTVEAVGQRGALRYEAPVAGPFAPCTAGSLTEFLMERYTAFTDWRGIKRRFRVWHPPWLQAPVEAEIIDDTLLELTGDWAQQARYIGANYSPGMCSVWMGRPHFLSP
ncbi:MAG: hypothetical protein RL693_1092 [Verrucomicrobiota bacterium]